MQERRRHQRVRFSQSISILVGSSGVSGHALIENISSSGLMVRTDLPLDIGRLVGCEFSLPDFPLIDVPARLVNRVGDLYGLRFLSGAISQIMIDDALVYALARGLASTLGVHEIDGRKILRITGGLHGGLQNDFMHALTRVGVDELDLGEVTAVDADGLALCVLASGRHQVNVGRQSACFARAWKNALNGSLDK